jgi:serine/threonine-protein kinase RsbW
MNTASTHTIASPVSCYKLPTFKGWLALSNSRNSEAKNMIIHEAHYVISSNMESVILLSETLHKECDNNSIPEETTMLIRLAIVEALNNIVEHSFKSESFHEIDVYFTFFQKNIRIRLTDNGRPNHNGIKPVDIDVDPEDIMNVPDGGYGLNIIHQVMDRVDYNRQNSINIMTMEKNL